MDGSLAQAGQHLEALKELCDTLSPEDAHRLAQTQLRECEKRLAAIQHQFSGDQDSSLPESRWKSQISQSSGWFCFYVFIPVGSEIQFSLCRLIFILCNSSDKMLKRNMQII